MPHPGDDLEKIRKTLLYFVSDKLISRALIGKSLTWSGKGLIGEKQPLKLRENVVNWINYFIRLIDPTISRAYVDNFLHLNICKPGIRRGGHTDSRRSTGRRAHVKRKRTGGDNAETNDAKINDAEANDAEANVAKVNDAEANESEANEVEAIEAEANEDDAKSFVGSEEEVEYLFDTDASDNYDANDNILLKPKTIDGTEDSDYVDTASNGSETCDDDGTDIIFPPPKTVMNRSQIKRKRNIFPFAGRITKRRRSVKH